MKICRCCQQSLPLESFGKHRSRKDGLQSCCKECSRRYQKRWYQKYHGTHKENTKKRRKQIVDENRRFIWYYLSTHSCIDCGNSNPIVLEFDHIQGNKKDCVSRMLGYSRKTIEEEIAKCEIRCSNCHKIKTAKQFDWYKDIAPEALR